MVKDERQAYIAKMQNDPENSNFWDMVAQEELEKLIQALEEEWGQTSLQVGRRRDGPFFLSRRRFCLLRRDWAIFQRKKLKFF